VRFLHNKVPQNWNQIVDLTLRVVGHVPRVSHMTGGAMQLMSPPMQTSEGTGPPVPNGLTPLLGSEMFLLFIALLQDVQITFSRMRTLVFTVCHQISSWCLIGYFQFDSLEPIVGLSSLWVGVIVIIYTSRCWLESIQLLKTSSARRNLFFIIRTIARTYRLSVSLQHTVLVYIIGPTCDVIVQLISNDGQSYGFS